MKSVLIHESAFGQVELATVKTRTNVEILKIMVNEHVVGWLYPGFFASIDWSTANEALGPLCGKYSNTMYGKEIPAPRESCVFGSPEYGGLTCVPWSGRDGDSAGQHSTGQELIRSIREDLEMKIMPGIWDEEIGSFDYALVHKYASGADHIGWHNDREALGKKGQDGSEVVSVTFLPADASPRPLSFKFLDRKYVGNGRELDVLLGHGDVLVMHKNCQSVFKHALLQDKPRVVTAKRVKRGYWHSRISITFRRKTEGGKRNPTETVRLKKAQAQTQARAEVQAQAGE